MASPLFRIHNANLADWKTCSKEIVSLKMAVRKDKKKIHPPIPPAFEMYLIVFLMYLKMDQSHLVQTISFLHQIQILYLE
jgi:hypothetical protein